MSDSDTIRVGTPLPVIASAVPAGGLSVRVEWADGRRDVVDLSGVAARYRMLRPLKDDPRLVAAMKVGYLGSSIEWGDDMDISAVMLDRLARCQRVMTTEEFREWMKGHGLTLDTAGPALGVSRRTVADMSAGHRTMDLTMTLACEGYDARIRASAAE